MRTFIILLSCFCFGILGLLIHDLWISVPVAFIGGGIIGGILDSILPQ